MGPNNKMVIDKDLTIVRFKKGCFKSPTFKIFHEYVVMIGEREDPMAVPLVCS